MLRAMHTLIKRPRRNRQSPAIRALIQETNLTVSDFVVPIFLIEGSGDKEPIPSLPGVYRYSLKELGQYVRYLSEMGVKGIDLFPVVPQNKKDPRGSEALKSDCLVLRGVATVKEAAPEMCTMVDIALDPYTDHGHDGLLNLKGEVDNDATLEVLTECSVMAAKAGADLVAPSDMMDGRVATIRRGLDEAGYSECGIMAYSAKYASSLYGPFRQCLGSGVKKGDKKGYQMNPGNVREALLEAKLDEEEGADILMVKPALSYLDVIAKLRENTNLPIAAYHVSGEYAMVMAAAEKGWADADKVLLEHLISIKRAGADMIFTYAIEAALRGIQ